MRIISGVVPEVSRLAGLQVELSRKALGRVGGILEARKIAGMAEANYTQSAPHLYAYTIEISDAMLV